MKCLTGKHDVLGIDKIPSDNVVALDIVKEPEQLREKLKGVDIVIHLAWDVREAGTSLNASIPDNKAMGEIVYVLSLEQQVKQFILASSVHVSLGHIHYRHPGIVEDHRILHEKKITTKDSYSPRYVWSFKSVSRNTWEGV